MQILYFSVRDSTPEKKIYVFPANEKWVFLRFKNVKMIAHEVKKINLIAYKRPLCFALKPY